MPKIQKINYIDKNGNENVRYTISLPKAIVESKRWEKGTILNCQFDAHGDLVLKQI